MLMPECSAILTFDVDVNVLELYRRDFLILRLLQCEATLLVQTESNTVLDHVPQNTVAIIVSSMAEAVIAEVSRFATKQGITEVPLIQHYPGLPTTLLEMIQRRERAYRQSSERLLQLAELRKIHEELQNSYDALRTLVSEHGIGFPTARFTSIPDPDLITIPDDFDEIVQPVPVELRALCGISLHVAGHMPSFAEGVVTAELFAPDDDDKRITWHIPFTSIAPGWLTFAFEQQGIFLRRNVVLRLTRKSIAGPGPLFSLGKPQLRPDKSAVVNGERLSRSLALKAWITVPGSPMNITNQMWPVIRLDGRPVTRIDLVIRDIEIVDVRRLHETLHFPPVRRLEGQQRIVVHPVGELPTVARLVDACPIGTQEIAAEVETDHEDAGLVEYGLALLPKGWSLYVEEDEILALTSSVDWVTVPAMTHGTVNLSLDEPLSRLTDLALMTRVPDGASPDNCWAHFKRIYFKGSFG